ncbi:MAG: double zinc ribbon domain-containing protein [Oscillospiraceae bacterium]|nr:double zinc ribbon domain-containing protein [Oscillospiraceae bacterium]
MFKYIQKLTDLVFPQKCAGCGKISERVMCAGCMAEITQLSMQYCARCRAPPYLCGCKKIENIKELIFPYFYYGEKLKFAVYKLKKSNLYYINEFFAKSMYYSLEESDKIEFEEIDFIACGPRARKSFNIYGYNQAEKLAKLIAGYSGIKFKRALKPAGNQQEQKTLSQSERFLNVRDKFIINKKIDINNENIIIIDDVVTTGATLSECAKVLKAAGANEIYALCAASTWN